MNEVEFEWNKNLNEHVHNRTALRLLSFLLACSQNLNENLEIDFW